MIFAPTLWNVPTRSRPALGDRRLRVAELLGRPPEGALVGDRLQLDQMAKVEPEPAISFHDRKVPAEQAG